MNSCILRSGLNFRLFIDPFMHKGTANHLHGSQAPIWPHVPRIYGRSLSRVHTGAFEDRTAARLQMTGNAAE